MDGKISKDILGKIKIWVSVTVKNMFYVPEGFAHGFLVLSDIAEFVYKYTDIHDLTSEGGILWDDEKHEAFKTQKFLRRSGGRSLLIYSV